MDIYNPDDSFDFNSISLANPQPAQAGSFFTKLSLDATTNKPLYIQLPKCVTKQNIVEAMNGKYCDLMYERTDEDKLMNWIEKFEHACQDKIDAKKSLWFQSDLSRDDIETMMSPMTRLYKSGKYILIRAYLNTSKLTSKDKCIAYDEHEMPIELDNISSDKHIIPLILIDGIKFSSRSFEIEIKLLQIMVIDPPTPIKEVLPICLIKNKTLPNLLSDKSETATVAPVAPVATAIDLANLEDNTIKLNIGETAVQGSEPVNNQNITFDGVEEVNLDFNDIKESITLKKPNDVYYEIYKAAREKAKHMRKVAIEAYLEAKEIKTKYMLSDIDDSEEESENEGENDMF